MEEVCCSSACMDCGMRSEGCCVNTMVLLTIEDIDNICSLGFRLEEFATVMDCIESDPFCDDGSFRDEGWWRNAGLMVEGRLLRATIKRKSDGSCTFLRNGKGCVLGRKRPAICRMFPAWIGDDGEAVCDKGIEYCEILKKNKDVKVALMEICEEEEDIRKIFNTIKQDCLFNSQSHAEVAAKLLTQTNASIHKNTDR